VGGDVVQLAADPQSLPSDRDPGRSFPVVLGVRRTQHGGLDFCRPLAEGERGEPGEGEPERDEAKVTERVARVVVDDDRRSSPDHHQIDASLEGITLAPSRVAAARPATCMLAVDTTSAPSTNDTATAISQAAAALMSLPGGLEYGVDDVDDAV
jgi:hypothetical protein